MSDQYPLPTEPEGMVATLLERWNTGKIDALMSVFDPRAVFVAGDGTVMTDRAEIAAELNRTLSLGLPMKAKARNIFVNDDIALLVLDWSIDGTGPDGKQVHFSGSAADILRRGPDGFWRYWIDNNQGTAVRTPV